MANIQERIAELMSEIHAICVANGITYYLDEQLAVQAEVNHALDANVTTGRVLMTAEDLKKFIAAFEESPAENREIEYLKTNGFYPAFNVKYVDASSVFYNMRRLACERCMGLYVIISVLKPVGLKSKVHQTIEQTWESLSHDEKIIGRRLGPVVAYRFRRSIVKQGRNKTASDLFDYLLEEYSGESRRNEYWTVKKTGKKVAKRSMVIPAKRTMVELYGHQLYTFETDTELFQELKEKYMRKKKKEFINSEMHFADADVSYKDLDLDQFRDIIRPMSAESVDIRRPAVRIRRKRRKYFNKLRKTHLRYYYGLLFEDQIDDLERMLKEGQFEQLEEIMDPYVEDLRKLKNIYIGERINNILREHYDIDTEEMFSDYQEFYKEGIKIYDYKGNYIRTVAGTKDE